MALTQFSAPGRLADFETPAQAAAWSNDLDTLFGEVMKAVKPCIPTAKMQFVNPLKVDTSAWETAEISWPGFPNALLAGDDQTPPLSPEDAYRAADAPGQAGRYTQDEYLEWFIHRNAADEIVAVDFTTETQHYWQSLYTMDKALAAATYGKILGMTVNVADITRNGAYDPLNRFNTAEGIVHLIHPNNTLGAELDIACQSTRLRTDDSGGETNDIVGCLRCRDSNAIGGGTRNSDPKIAAAVSAKADTGCRLTIPDPVGLYIARLDTSGWKTPDNSDPQACWKAPRGNPAVRARFEVPGGAFKISDIKINGAKIRHAGQIADHVFVKLTAALGPAGQVQGRPSSPCTGGGAAGTFGFTSGGAAKTFAFTRV